MENEQINLNKYISSSGFCSRREADKLIEQGRVTINGEVVSSSLKVYEGDVVEVDGEPIRISKKRPVYIAFNKPVGVTSTTDLKDKTNIISFISHTKRIFPIGRLDKDSDGLIFLTNDGDIVNKILRASNNHEKEYIVTVDKAITPDFITKMSGGVAIQGAVTKKCFVRQEGGRRFRIMLTQGLNRQIRRMCETLGYKVVSLTRVRIMNIVLGSMPVGHWRYFTGPEIDKLNEMVASSTKLDAPAGKTKKSKPADGERPVQYIPKRRKDGGAPADAEGRPASARPSAAGRPSASGKPSAKKTLEGKGAEKKAPAKKSFDKKAPGKHTEAAPPKSKRAAKSSVKYTDFKKKKGK